MNFYKRISFRIWLYFSFALVLVFIGTSWYYSSTQRSLIIESRGRELQEFCRTIAIGVEISLDMQNFIKLRKAVDNFNERGKEFDFLLLTQELEGGREILFTFLSTDSNFVPEQLDSSLYLIRYQHYSSPIMSGKIICGMAKEKIDRHVSALNRPVILTLLLIFALSFVLFFFLARGLSKPVSRAIDNAHLLGQNRFAEFNFSKSSRSDEIGLLEDALLTLRDSLMDQKTANERLINTLEEEVSKRTASLNEAFEKLSDAQKIARLAAFSWHTQSDEWSVSDNMFAILGTEKGEPITSGLINNRVDPSYRKLFTEIFIRAKEHRVQEALKFLQPDGEIRWLNIICIFKQDERSGYFSGTIQDITLQKVAEEEMERLSLLATNTTNLVVFTDKQERIIWVNDSLVKLTGYSREELYGNTPRIFQSKNTRTEDIERIHQAILQVKPVKAEVLNRGKSGNEYWLELYIQPQYSKEGEHTGFMAIEIDITERKNTEDKLRNYVREIEDKQTIINSINTNLEKLVAEKTRDLEHSMDMLKSSQDELVRREKMATLGMLAAGIAHEVNTPLGAIKASSENLNFLLNEDIMHVLHTLSGEELGIVFTIFRSIPSDQRFTTQQERAAIRRLQNMLEERHQMPEATSIVRMLAILRFENTDALPKDFFVLPHERMKVLLGIVTSLSGLRISISTIETAVSRASKIIRALNVYSHGEESAPHAPFDLRESLNAVADLLSNKLKQGSVFLNNIPSETIVIGQEDELSQVWTNLINNALQASNNKCTIKVEADFAEQGMVHVMVENDGPPIPPAILGRIFDEFFTTKKRGEGTGLGLSIVSKIVERHGGKISCRSEEGSTVFEVSLPLATRQQEIEKGNV